MKPKAIQFFFLIAILFLLSACSGEVNGQPEPQAASENTIDAGRQLIASYGCGACHTIPGVPGADATAAPPLKRFYERSYIAGRIPNNMDNLIMWIQNPQLIDPETAMPNLGVTQNEARAIAAYLYHQQTIRDWIRR